MNKRNFALILATLALALTPNVAVADAPAAVANSASANTVDAAPASNIADNATMNAAAPAEVANVAAPAEQKPVAGIGQPIPGAWWLQPQVTDNGKFAMTMHDVLLMPLITVISLFVLGLLLYVTARYRKTKNPKPSKTSHNTVIEVIWTGLPVLILAGVFIPSFNLLRAQYAKVPANAITLKVTGNQWYWTYKYPDNGDFEIVSNMLSDAAAKAAGEPRLLAVDNRVVVPVNTPVKVITTSNDVIHSFVVPAFWTKMDAVPGRLNETSFKATQTGVYYGQCSALCGANHAYMPIVVEVVTMDKFNQWVLAHGGKLKGAASPTPAPTAAANAAPTTLAKN